MKAIVTQNRDLTSVSEVTTKLKQAAGSTADVVSRCQDPSGSQVPLKTRPTLIIFNHWNR